MSDNFTTVVFRPPNSSPSVLASSKKLELILTPKQVITPTHERAERESKRAGQELARNGLLKPANRAKINQVRLNLRIVNLPPVPEELPSPVASVPAPKRVLHCSSASRPGMIEGRVKPHNQDSYLVCEMDIKGQSAYLLVVSDGHGESGHAVSSYVTTYLPCFFLEALEKQSNLDIGQALTDAYHYTNESMKKCDFDAVCSGATCVAVILTNRQMYCANVGDSRAILGLHTDDTTTTAEELTQDHKPFIEAEQVRILAAGGRVQPQYSSNGQAVGPLRVWFQRENAPGLAMTRAMGDFLASSIGVISTPDVVKIDMAEADSFIVLASDGVWEFMSTQEVVDLVQNSFRENHLEESAQLLITEAAQRWARVLNTVDDITAIVAFLG